MPRRVLVPGLGSGEPLLPWAKRAEVEGWRLIGPSVECLRRWLDPLRLRQTAELVGIDTVPWCGKVLHTLEEVQEHAARLGFPVLVRAPTAVQAGLGVARTAEQLKTFFEAAAARSERAGAAYAGGVLLERLLPGVRRLEVPFVTFPDGRRWILDVIDASLRRREGSVIVEAPAPGLAAAIEAKLNEAVEQFARVLRHEHVGSMVFLHRPGTAGITFLGYEFGRGGEHAAAEMLRGIDLAKLRASMALGLPTPGGEAPAPRGHAMAAQLRVDGSSRDPLLMHFRPASGPGVRTDSDARAGDRLSPSGAVAEIIAHGADRAEALARLQGALEESAYLVEGGETSMSALLNLTRSAEFRSGSVVADWWIQHARGMRAREHAAQALLVAAADAHAVGHAVDREEFIASATRGRAETRPPTRRTFELLLDGHAYAMRVTALDIDRYEIETDAGPVSIRFERGGQRERILLCGGRRHVITSNRSGSVHAILVDGEPHRVVQQADGAVRADLSAIVVDVGVQIGDRVEAGAALATLETMKMELEVFAPHAGRVLEVQVRPGQQVSPSQPLVWIEGAKEEAAQGPDRVAFDGLAARSAPPRAAELLLSFFRGFDVTAEAAQRAVEELPSSGEHADLLAAFLRLLDLGPSSQQIAASPQGGLRRTHAEYVGGFLTSWDPAALPAALRDRLEEAARAYGARSLARTPALTEALFRIHMAIARRAELVVVLLGLLGRQLEAASIPELDVSYRGLLDRLIALTQSSLPEVCETARAVQFRLFDGPHLARLRARYLDILDEATRSLEVEVTREAIERLVAAPPTVTGRLVRASATRTAEQRAAYLEILLRRYYRDHHLEGADLELLDADLPLTAVRIDDGAEEKRTVIGWLGDLEGLRACRGALREHAGALDGPVGLELVVVRTDASALSSERLLGVLTSLELPAVVDRVVFILGPTPGEPAASVMAGCRTFLRGADGFAPYVAGQLHPMIAARLGIDRLAHFDLELLASEGDLYAFLGTGRDQPEDRRLFVHAEVRDLTPVRDDAGELAGFPELEQVCDEALACLRRIRRATPAEERTDSNRVELYLRPPVDEELEGLARVLRHLAPATVGLGLEEILLNARSPTGARTVLRLSNPSGLGVEVRVEAPRSEPVPRMSPYEQKVARLRRRGLTHPHELARLLTQAPGLPEGRMEELDLDAETGRLVPVERGPGENESAIVVGRITTFTEPYPEGMTRIALFGDPSRAMGALAEPECRRIIAALDLAEHLDLPMEWYALSGGAEISLSRGTENLDWVAAVVRRLVEYTQRGRELNVVVCGINVGAHSLLNAQATMLMHTKGILVMVPGSAMVLVGKQALDFSSGISAEDNAGIGGYDRIMGPNGQAQILAEDLLSAGQVLLRHYAHSYRAPGERFPRRRPTSDPVDRDVRAAPHGPAEGTRFETVGQIFSSTHNPVRKRPFDIRSVMRAVADVDHAPLERWRDMRGAETVVTWDAHLGGYPVALLGIESRPIRRVGPVPGDGPKLWAAGTLVPRSSKKMARAIHAASGIRPLVVLANLSGFDGSPESLRTWQLEYGAEIGRAIVNFDGPIVFTVISRLHGAAFAAFSNRLHDRMEVLAVEGAYASVIGGAPAAAVVFARELARRVAADPRVRSASDAVHEASGPDKASAGATLRGARAVAHAEHLGQLAREYDDVHSIERAQEVGSVHRIIPAARLRPELIAAVERGIARTEAV
jgi:acetyl/propionyl-CoA carboxylase alpha subunit/acetyl-CoA carboxylase carboxyltransferase component